MNNEQKIEILERKLAEANREISIYLTSLKEKENLIEELKTRLESVEQMLQENGAKAA